MTGPAGSAIVLASMASRKPTKPKAKADDRVPMHRLQLDIPLDVFTRYKADCVIRGTSIRLDLVNHMRSRLGLPAIAKDELPPGGPNSLR